MVPKPVEKEEIDIDRFRAVLFRMVPKHGIDLIAPKIRFRAVLFRMVPKQ